MGKIFLTKIISAVIIIFVLIGTPIKYNNKLISNNDIILQKATIDSVKKATFDQATQDQPTIAPTEKPTEIPTEKPTEVIPTEAEMEEDVEIEEEEKNIEEEILEEEEEEEDFNDEQSDYIEENTSIEETFAEYSANDFRNAGIIKWGDWTWTYYSEKILPGEGLYLPGRHTDSNGYICDGDGFLCLASSSLPWGTIVNTPFGKQGKVYDSGCAAHILDVYVSW